MNRIRLTLLGAAILCLLPILGALLADLAQLAQGAGGQPAALTK